ncbi:predicted protein [Naegleria gruberi]|uniref:Predicted protein n=1 Tax=Naegleria gruberi TaxID=5762 RepID=D2W373_NAEGR|nr:uncharacterized protein NAEGRDRAFT_75844 [Naegleria gruberi]EFC36467.1 predicted protein [Naegleria gruberi]|eukprot:XP_002669211.1 predicted protein [Naegleria gruberi strain NEG-M]
MSLSFQRGILIFFLLLVNQFAFCANLPNGVDQGDYYVVPIGGARVKEYGFLSISSTEVQLHSQPKTPITYSYGPLSSGMVYDSTNKVFNFNPGAGQAGKTFTIQRNSTYYNQQSSKTITQTDYITINVESAEKLTSTNLLLQQDNFTTSNGMGGGWISTQGSHSISSNSLTINSANTITISKINVTSNDVTFQIIANSYYSSPGRGFIFNYIDSNNYYEIQLQNPGPLTITRVLNGQRTVIHSSTLLVGAYGNPVVTTNHKIYVKKVNNAIQISIGQLSVANADYLVNAVDSDTNAMKVFYSNDGKIGFFDKYVQSGSRFKILQVSVWKGKVLHTYSIAPQIYWVNQKNGTDLNTGKSYASAWETISRAQYMLFPDDTLYIYPGTYRETLKIQYSSIPGHPISIKGVNNQVRLDGSYPINMNTVQSVSTTLPFKIYTAPLQRDSVNVNVNNNNFILAMRPLPANSDDYFTVDNYLTINVNNTNFTPPNALLNYMKLDETFRYKADGSKVSDNYWVNATIFHYTVAGTITISRKILYYNNVTNIIGVAKNVAFLVNDKYSMANHPGLISKVGQYAVVNSQLYVAAASLPNNIQVSMLQTGINIIRSEYYIFSSLNITRFETNILIWNKNQTLVKTVQTYSAESQMPDSLKLEVLAHINRVITNTSLLYLHKNDIVPSLNTTHGVAYPFWLAITKRGLISSVNGSVSSPQVLTDVNLYNEVIGLNRAVLDELALDLRVKKSLNSYYPRTVDMRNNVFVNSPIQKPTLSYSLTPYWNIDHNYVMTDISVVKYWQYIDWPSVMDVKKNVYETSKNNLAYYFNNALASDFTLRCNVTNGITLIDKGVKIDGISYNGLTNDIGAFESNCSSSNSITTTAVGVNNLANQVLIQDNYSVEEVKTWTSHQLFTKLSANTGLSETILQPFLEHDFNGNSLVSVLIDEKSTVDTVTMAMINRFLESKNAGNISLEFAITCRTVANWAFNNIRDEVNVIKSYSELSIMEKLKQQMKGLTDDAKLSWYQTLEKLIQGQSCESMDRKEDVNNLFNTAFTLFYSGKRKKDYLNIEQVKQDCPLETIDKEKVTFKNQIVMEQNPSPLSLKDVKVPLLMIQKSTLVKEILPFIPNFQVDLQDDSERIELNNHIIRGDTVSLIAPSGTGKTALISRRLGVNLGVLFTCCRDDTTNFRGTDYCSLNLNNRIEDTQTALELFATARQLVHCNLIARLIYLDLCVDMWKDLEHKPFKQCKQFLAYAQYTGNTKAANRIFNYLIKNRWVEYDIEELRNCTSSLVNNLIQKLGASTEPFIFAFDEANVFSIKETFLLSKNGTLRDILTLLHSEISIIRGRISTPVCDIYCGTCFTADVIDIVQSNNGKHQDITNNIFSFFGLDSISATTAKNMIGLMHDTNYLKNLFDKEDEKIIFPTRRRVIGLVCEKLTTNFKNQPYSEFKKLIAYPFKSMKISPLKLCWIEFTNSITETVLAHIKNKKISLNILQEMFIRATNTHIFSTSLIHGRESMAATLVGSGLATPKGIYGDYFFDCSDTITKQVCTNIMMKKFPQTYEDCTTPMKVLRFLLSCEDLQDAKYWKTIFALILQHYNSKPIQDVPFLKVKGATLFRATCQMDALEFYTHYSKSTWATEALDVLNSIIGKYTKPCTGVDEPDFTQRGDFLYWYCISKLSDKTQGEYFRQIVDGLIYFPTNLCHPDLILLNNNTLYLTSSKLHNCSQEAYSKSVLKRKSLLDRKFFYINNFTKATTVWWKTFKPKLQNFFENCRFCKIFAHFNVELDKLNTEKTTNNFPNSNTELVQQGLISLEKDTQFNFIHLSNLPVLVGHENYLLLVKYFERIKFDERKEEVKVNSKKVNTIVKRKQEPPNNVNKKKKMVPSNK